MGRVGGRGDEGARKRATECVSSRQRGSLKNLSLLCWFLLRLTFRFQNGTQIRAASKGKACEVFPSGINPTVLNKSLLLKFLDADGHGFKNDNLLKFLLHSSLLFSKM